MCKRLQLIGLLVVGVTMLSGCDLIDQIIDSITGGGGPGGGTVMSEDPISGRMKFDLDATVWRDDRYTPISSYEGSVGTTFWSGAGIYEGGVFEAIWDGGDFSHTLFGANLSEDGKTIINFLATQMQANIWGGYTYYHYILGVNLPYSHKEGNSRYYRVEGAAASALTTELDFRMWVPGSATGGGFDDPIEWIIGGQGVAPVGLTGSADDYIEIRLDYQNTATSPFD